MNEYTDFQLKKNLNTKRQKIYICTNEEVKITNGKENCRAHPFPLLTFAQGGVFTSNYIIVNSVSHSLYEFSATKHQLN